MIILQLICWISLFLVFYSYLLFPLIIRLLAKNRELSPATYTREELPLLSVLISAYNEEEVIGEKIITVLESDYPAGLLEILVGSDGSSDNTNNVLKQLQKQYPVLKLFLFEERQGKPGVINQLAKEARGEILVITDANVMLQKETLSGLATYFRDGQTGLVDSRMVNTGINNEGISRQERFYISREVWIKHHESILWGTMMGPFGGCYAVRKSLYRPVPDNFLVDDFFINMAVLQQGYACISNINATVHEDVSNKPGEEFRRKKRISAGNYQNLALFRSMLFRGRKGAGFCFFSHKVLRWMVPFLVLLSLGSSAWLGMHLSFYLAVALLHILVLIIPFIDYILRKIRMQILPLRFISHFVLMNLALLAGFFRYLGGIRNNVWQPTSRIQDRSQ